ncbi:hypothetical protein [Pseudomonas lundensis]|uniref:hypothetical protein n=1 Tax=Pseudomonas lundensis TaxID=86185 RepID=UPI001642A764|nr:hypothetical protein [Pseudomonas lundensis]
MNYLQVVQDFRRIPGGSVFNQRQQSQAWKVSLADIVARNYNLDIKNPHVGEQAVLDPDKLLTQYQEQQKDIQKLHDQLKAVLSAALNGAI